MDYAKPQRLCVGAMAHIISKRKVALIQKRYIWRQSPGGELADVLLVERRRY